MAQHNFNKNNFQLFDINDLLSNENLKSPRAVLKQLIPMLDDNQYSAVADLKLSVVLPRENQPLGKALKLRPQKTANGFETLNEDDVLEFLKAIKNLSDSMPPGWNKIAATEITFDWRRAVEKDMPNANLWRQALGGQNVFEAPSFQEGDGFTVEVYPAVVNPDQPGQVWSIGDAIPLDALSKDGKVEKDLWDNYINTHRDELEKQFDFAKDPRVLKPQLQIFWRIIAPDGETFSLPRAQKAQWRQNHLAQAWLTDRLNQIEVAYARAALFGVGEVYNSVASGKKRIANDTIAEKDWDLIDQSPPQSLKEFDKMLLEMADANPSGLEKIKASFISIAPEMLYGGSAWKQKRWMNAVEFRQALSDRPFVTDEEIDQYMVHEQKSFVKASSSTDGNLSEFAKKLNDDEKLKLLDLIYWNDCNVSETTFNVLTNNVIEEVTLDGAPAQPNNNMVKNVYSLVDWQPLVNAFDVSEAVKDNEDELSFEAHPFSNWMMRLSPPKDVEATTKAWIEENETFNDINRLILRKKESDESALNLQLVDKLNKVITTSNQIMEDSRQSGGWWGRVRKNLSQAEGPTSDQWADVYLEFQDHMVTMLEDINRQVERDKMWLRYADGIKKSSQNVDTEWQKWLSETAQRLQVERESLDDTVTSEKKIQWNNQANVLEGAQSAYEHIKTANTIGHILLEKVRQSVSVKERLQQRTMMFYWSSLNMFAGLQSLQRNTNGVGEQSEFVEEMAKAFQGGLTRSLKEEAEQKEKIREAFKNMAQSETGMNHFYETIASFQKDTVAIINDLSVTRDQLQGETADVIAVSSKKVQEKRKARQMEVEVETPNTTVSGRTKSTGPQ